MTTTFNITLYTYLKNADLHAISAFEALSNLLHISSLKGLKRYGVWTMTIEAPSQEDASKKLNKILDTTYYIVNPNKEAYFQDTIPKLKNTAQQKLIKVSPTDAFDASDIISKIKQKCDVTIKNIEKGQVWELLFKDGTVLNNEEIKDNILISSSRKKGLLVNPLYETFEFIHD